MDGDDSKETKFDELSERILFGCRKACFKLIIETSETDGTLVIGDEKENYWHEPARNLFKKALHEYPKEFRAVLKEYQNKRS